ncbi:hydroxypyruvate isomerase family protein, partial [Streptomyces sp. NPDC059037]|uniref:hydroxypyruvate isomerase family protein n=1 Tax=Streptomyces sp. NPDC059037 TaxID=3346710 RepID=UPI0036AC8D10
RGGLADPARRLVFYTAPPGEGVAGARGIASPPGREAEFRSGFDRALAYAVALGCGQVHVMAGLRPADAAPAQLAEHRAAYLDNLTWAAQRATAVDVDVLIEPINGRDMPGYFLHRQAEAHAIVREVGAPNLKVQLDLYHCQIVEGDLTTTLRRDLPTGRVAHLQIAGVPDRHEPDQGELDIQYLFDVVDELGFEGWIGCEYRPRSGTSEGLGWLKNYGRLKNNRGERA